jgi:hypothetical protein
MSRRAAYAVAVALSLAAAPAQASDKSTPGQKAYLEGVNAYNTAGYDTAVEKLRTALAADGNEGLAKFQATGLNKEDYLPHFYLGLSLEKLGQKDAALAELKESERQGAVQGRGSLNRLLEAAMRRLAPVQVAVVAPTRAAPTSPPPPPATATRAAPPTPRVEAPRSEPTHAAPPRGEPARPAPTPAAAPTHAPVHTAPAPTRPEAKPEHTSAQETALAAAREGIRTYFKGDFAGAARLLTPVADQVPAARLFLSYALASGQLLASKRDETVVAQARREYEKARHDAGAPPDETAISPAVRSLLAGKP